MRKLFFSCALSFLGALFAFSQNGVQSVQRNNSAESILGGIWQGTDRLILFENSKADGSSQESNETADSANLGVSFDFSVVLRVFYAWYDDRAAEDSSFREIKTRDRNDAEARTPEDISVRCRTLFENESKNAGVYELELIYPSAVYSSGKVARKESLFVPIAVIDGKIYLDFLVNPDVESENGVVRVVKSTSNAGYWGCASNADGITISPPRFKKEVHSYYVLKNEDGSGNDAVYRLRYWKSGMDYDPNAVATFTDGNKTFEVPKFLKIGAHLYQCTTGRGTKIRNIEKTTSMPSEVVYDSDFSICAFGKPYLVRVPNGETKEDLLAIVTENNKRRKDPPKPIFPVSEINFHWKEITELEKYNPFTWNRRNIDLGK